MERQIFGIDIATTTGVAHIFEGSHQMTAYEHTGTPQDLLKFITECFDSAADLEFHIEMLNSFRNANTTRKLLTKAGYIAHSLEAMGWPVSFPNVSSVRYHLRAKNKLAVQSLLAQRVVVTLGKKKFTGNHADAIALILYAEKLQPSDIEITIGG